MSYMNNLKWAHAEAKKAIKRTHMQLSDVNAAIEEERKVKMIIVSILIQNILHYFKRHRILSHSF